MKIRVVFEIELDDAYQPDEVISLLDTMTETIGQTECITECIMTEANYCIDCMLIGNILHQVYEGE